MWVLRSRGLRFLGSGLTDPDLALAAALLLYGAYDLQYPAALNGPQFLGASLLKRPFVVEDGARLTVPLDSAATVSDLLVRLRTADVEVRELSLSKPTLDEVFLALTGHGAADAEDRDAGEHASQKVNA